MDTPTQQAELLAKSGMLIHESSTPTETNLLDTDPLLSGIGIGVELWADEPADEYVTRLRKDW